MAAPPAVRSPIVALINGLQELLGARHYAPTDRLRDRQHHSRRRRRRHHRGRGGDDLIDGDKWLNVRISVRANVDGTGPEIASFDSMTPMIPLMLDGTYNPGQLVAVREIK